MLRYFAVALGVAWAGTIATLAALGDVSDGASFAIGFGWGIVGGIVAIATE